jgi:two-component system response regulator FixJ
VTERESVTGASEAPIVYIIDDDKDVRESIGFMLRTDGIASRAFAGGQEFMTARPSLAPGCLLLDLRMPQVSGLDVMTALKEQGCSWPVVVMTGQDDADLGTTAIRLGARDLIAKPFDADVLLHCLRRSGKALNRALSI